MAPGAVLGGIMLTLKCKVDGTNLTVTDKAVSVKDSVNYIRLEIDFDASWEGLIKTSYWRNARTGKIYAAVLQEDACYAPMEALTDKGYVYFALAGEREGYRVTTTKRGLWLDDTIYGGTPAQPPTPTQYDQMIEIMRDTQQISQSVREDADSGNFNGATGAKGDPGQAATIKIGSVTTGEAGSKASVANTGTVNDAIFDFTIPQGQPGKKGDQGEPGKDGETPYIGENGNWYIGMDDTGKPSRGEQGLPGQDGAPGKDGEPGKDGAPGENAADEQVRAAVDAYMQENPVETGATEEQAAQIERNTQDIQSLSAAIKRKSDVIIASESGQPIMIEDSAEAELEDLQIQGWTEQETTAGAQILNYEEWQKVGILNGSGTWSDNGIVITSASAGDAYTNYETYSISVEPGKSYTLSWEHSGASGLVIVFFKRRSWAKAKCAIRNRLFNMCNPRRCNQDNV